MKYELSHDILAKKVYEKSSQEDRMLRKIETFIGERYDYFLAQGVMLVKEDLEYISPYLSKVTISDKEKNFINESRKKVRRSEGRKIVTTLAAFVLPVLVALLAWALFQTYEANKALQNVQIQKIIAEENAIKAKIAEKEALEQKEIADENAIMARKQEQLAKQQSEIVKKQALQLSKEAERARKAANRAAYEAKKAEEEAKRAEVASREAKREAQRAQDSEEKALKAKQEAEMQEQLALKAREQADVAARKAKQAEAEAKEIAREARALYLASLADNALRLKKGIVAYNLAKISWNMDKNLVAQKVLFDCQNAYLTDKSIFEEYRELSFQTYQEQVAIQFDQEKQVKNIEAWAKSVRDQVEVGGIYRATFSHDKKLLALLLLNKVYIRNTNDNKTLASIPLKSKAKAIHFSSDDELILIVLENNTVELYDNKGTLIQRLMHESSIVSAAFSPKGSSYITTVSEDGTGKLWDEKGDLIQEFQVFFTEAQVHPLGDGQSIVRLSKDNRPEIVNVFTRDKTVFKTPKRQKNTKVNTHISPNGKYILIQTAEKVVELWNIDGTLASSIAPNENPEDAQFSPSGNEIITASSIDKKAKLWDLNGTQLAEFNYDGYDKILSVEFSEDRMRVLVCREKIANLWGKKGRLLYSFSPKKQIISTSFSADNQSILIATKDGELQSWNVVTPEEIIKYYDNSVNIRQLDSKEISEYEILTSDLQYLEN